MFVKPSNSIESHDRDDRIFTVVSFILFCLCFCFLFWFLNVNLERFLNSDDTSELMLAKILADENRLITPSWFYSTELRVFNTQILYAFLFKFFNNWHKIRIVSDILLTLTMLVSGYDSYVKDGIHLNDAGHALYSEAVEGVIEEQIKTKALPVRLKEQPKHTNTSFFDNSYWIPSERFTRNGNTYSIELPNEIKGSGIPSFNGKKDVLMVIDIIDYPGENVITVYNNGKKTAERKNDWKYSFRQRHIPEISYGLVIEKGSFIIDFSSTEQADSFKGCGFILGK